MINDNYIKIRKILYIILLANFFVAICKIIIGHITKSLSLLADGFHSLSDGASNIVGIISITLASKPEDKEHPYGHKKFETMASLIISAMLLFIVYNVMTNSISKIYHPQNLIISSESLIVLIVTLLINILVASYENSRGKKYNSSFLIADSIHTKSDIFVSIGVLVTLVSVKLGVPPIIDVIVSFIVAGFIIYAAYEIFLEAASVLTDKVILTEEEVKNVVLEFNKVKSVHKIRSRGYIDHIFLDMHILVDSNLNVDEVHKLVHEIEDRFKYKKKIDVDAVIHVEPYCDEEMKEIKH